MKKNIIATPVCLGCDEVVPTQTAPLVQQLRECACYKPGGVIHRAIHQGTTPGEE